MNGLQTSAVDPPRDVLAAEEFVLPAPDPLLRPERLELPTDLVGGEARDVLVAEEFAIPAPDEAHRHPVAAAGDSSPVRRLALLNLPVLIAALWAWRRLRRP